MRVIAAITESTIAKRILDCMGLPPKAPPLTPACTSGSVADPGPEEAEAAGFDQSPPDEWSEGAYPPRRALPNPSDLASAQASLQGAVARLRVRSGSGADRESLMRRARRQGR
jgi:hypothetical protein